MGAIETKLTLKDYMSNPLKEISNSLKATSSAIEGVKATDLGSAFDNISASSDSLGKAMASASADTDGLGKAMGGTEGDADGLGKGLNNLPKDASGLPKITDKFKDMGKAIVVVNQSLQLLKAGFGAVSGMFGTMMSEHRDNLRGSVQLQTVLANNLETTYELEHAINEVNRTAMEIEKATGLASGGLVAGAGELARYTNDVEALTVMMHTLSDFSVGMAKDVNMSQDQMTQYANKLGMAMDGNYRQLERMGKTLTDEQKNIISYGTEMERALVISDVVNDSWYGLAETMGSTAIGAIAKFERQVVNAQAVMGHAITELKGAFLTFALDVGLNLEAMAIRVRSAFIDNLDLIAQGLVALGIVAGVVAIKFAKAWFLKLLPIIKVGAAVVAVTKLLNLMGVTNSKVLGYMMGAWNFFKYGILNVFIIIENAWGLATTVWKNLNDDALGTISRAWFDTMTGIARLYNSTIGAMAGVIGLDWKIDIDARNDTRAGMGQNAHTFTPRALYSVYDKTHEGFARGYEIGTSLDNTISNLQNLDWDASLGLSAMGSAYMGAIPDIGSLNDFATTSGGGGKALNVHNTEPLQISGEDVRMLRDLATKQAVINYRQITPQINITTGDIMETADVESIIKKLTDDLTDCLNTDLGGGFA